MIGWLVVALLLWAWPVWAGCTGSSPTLTAQTASRADVNACYNIAIAGDTIEIPAGTITDWTTTFVINQRITLKGAGIDQTIIQDSTSPRVPTIKLQASINWAGDIYANCPRLTGLTITRNPAVTANADFGTLTLVNCVIVDHIKIDSVFGQMVDTFGAVGVVSESIFTSARHGSYVHVFNTSWKGSTDNNGDYSWFYPTAAGTAHNIYWEENQFINQGDINAGAGFDANGKGGRYAVRFSTFIDGATVSNHPIGHGERSRSGRHLELYENLFNWTRAGSYTSGSAANMTGGTILAAKNELRKYVNQLGLTYWRANDDSTYWRTSAGRSAWDVNPAPTFSGTDKSSGAYNAASPTTSGTAFTMTDSALNVAAINLQQGGVIWNVTRNWGTNITSVNVANHSVTAAGCRGNWPGQGVSCSFTYRWYTGDQYEIRAPGPYPVIDGPGRGSGNLILGTPPLFSPGGGTGWPNQTLEPIYVVAGIYGAGSAPGGSSTQFAAINRDYYIDNPGNCVPGGACTAGTGTGATLPTTCTPRVGFWKTNEGNWNTTVSANTSGKMYVCVSTNTWTPLWGDNTTGEPYTYPHPLRVTGAPPPPVVPSAPTGLQIVP